MIMTVFSPLLKKNLTRKLEAQANISGKINSKGCVVMKTILGLLFVLSSLFLISCEEDIPIDPKSPAHAYMMMIEDLYANSTGLAFNNTYLAADLTLFDTETKEQLSDLVEIFAHANDLLYLEMTMDELVEAGYVETNELPDGQLVPTFFTEGVLFRFSDLDITDETEFAINISLWKGNMGATGGLYEATLTDETWTVTRTSHWVA